MAAICRFDKYKAKVEGCNTDLSKENEAAAEEICAVEYMKIAAYLVWVSYRDLKSPDKRLRREAMEFFENNSDDVFSYRFIKKYFMAAGYNVECLTNPEYDTLDRIIHNIAA